MNYTVNDKIDVAGYSFDLQVEIRRGYFVGEIFFQGRVIKRVEKKCPADLPSEERRESVLAMYRSLKDSLLSKLKSKAQDSFDDAGDFGVNEDFFKKELLKILDIKESALENFFLEKGDIRVFISSGNKAEDLEIDKWFDLILSSVDSPFVKNASFFLFSLKLQKKDFVLIFVKKDEIKLKFGLLVSETRLSAIRNRIRKREKDILKILEKKTEKEKNS